jgi:hypothetical protein
MPITPKTGSLVHAYSHRFLQEQRERLAEMDRQAMRDLRRAHIERMRSLLTSGIL